MDANFTVRRRSRRIAEQSVNYEFPIAPSLVTEDDVPANLLTGHTMQQPATSDQRRALRRQARDANRDRTSASHLPAVHSPPILRSPQQDARPPEGPFTFTHNDPRWPLPPYETTHSGQQNLHPQPAPKTEPPSDPVKCSLGEPNREDNHGVDETEKMMTDTHDPVTEMPVSGPAPAQHLKQAAKVDIEDEITWMCYSSCVICFDDFLLSYLRQPCRSCDAFFCESCITMMFERAARGFGPIPQCCAILQLHVGLPLLSAEQGEMYCKRFEQWLAVDKVYCPVETCSTFIPERLYHPGQAPPPKFTDFAKSECPKIIRTMLNHEDDKIWTAYDRREDSSAEPNRPQGLYAMQRTEYTDWKTFLSDLDRVLDHGITSMTDDQLRNRKTSLLEVAYTAMNKIALQSTTKVSFPNTKPTIIACPTCSIGICLECRQKAHVGRPCDTSVRDYEIALMTQYGYKQCPICKTAVKRMYGCSHIQCHCGAHWCWMCQSPIDKCYGDCDDDIEDQNVLVIVPATPAEGGADSTSADPGIPAETIPVGEDAIVKAATTATVTQPRNVGPDGQELIATNVGDQPRSDRAATTQVPRPDHADTDLDAGGDVRWGGSGMDFGEEPEQTIETKSPVWTCAHRWHSVRADGSDKNVKNGTVVHCNRCFRQIQVHRRRANPTPPSKKVGKVKSGQTERVETAIAPIMACGVPATAQGSDSAAVDMASLEQDKIESWSGSAESDDHEPTQLDGIIKTGNAVPPDHAPTSRFNTAARKHHKAQAKKADLIWDCNRCNLLYCGPCKDILIERRRAAKGDRA